MKHEKNGKSVQEKKGGREDKEEKKGGGKRKKRENNNRLICMKIWSPHHNTCIVQSHTFLVAYGVIYLLYCNKSVNICDMSAHIFSTYCTCAWRTLQQFLLPDTEMVSKLSPSLVLMTLITSEGNWVSSETELVSQEILFNLYSNSGTFKFQPVNHLWSLSWMIIQQDNTAKTILHLGAITSLKRTFSTKNLQ